MCRVMQLLFKHMKHIIGVGSNVGHCRGRPPCLPECKGNHRGACKKWPEIESSPKCDLRRY